MLTPAVFRGDPMALWSTIYKLMYAPGAIGLIALVWGMRARRLDDHPICHRCGYDLYGLESDKKQCLECGGDLAGLWAIRIGHRTRHRSMIIGGLVPLMIAVGIGWVADWRLDEIRSRPIRFIQAVQGGKIAETDRLLTLEPQLAHDRKHRGHTSSLTALQWALVFGKNPKVIARILQERPDLGERSDRGDTILHLAVERQMHAEGLQLLRLGSVPNLVNGGAAPRCTLRRRWIAMGA